MSQLEGDYGPVTAPVTAASLPSGIDAAKIADGSISNAEYQRLNGVSSDIQTQLNAKAPTASPTFTGTVSGVTKSMVGLDNVDNTSDANKPISTATQTALDGKVDGTAGVKVYRALLTQASTDPPTATVLENSLGEVPGFQYSDVGSYGLTVVAALFAANKTFVTARNIGFGLGGEAEMQFFSAKRSSNTNIDLLTSVGAAAGGGAWAVPVPSNAILSATEIQILVYP